MRLRRIGTPLQILCVLAVAGFCQADAGPSGTCIASTSALECTQDAITWTTFTKPDTGTGAPDLTNYGDKLCVVGSDRATCFSDGDGWVTSPDFAETRAWPAAAEFEGRLCVIGGFNYVPANTSLTTVECSPPGELNSWSGIASLPEARLRSQAFVISSKLCVSGGELSSGALSTVYCLSTIAGEWASYTSLSTGRYGFGTVWFSGALWAIGGYGVATMEKTSDGLVSWEPAGAITSHGYDTAAVLPNGELCVVCTTAPATTQCSEDGITWVARTTPTLDHYYGKMVSINKVSVTSCSTTAGSSFIGACTQQFCGEAGTLETDATFAECETCMDEWCDRFSSGASSWCLGNRARDICEDSCDLRVDSDDIGPTWMSDYAISNGDVTVQIQEQLEWIIEDGKPTLTGDMVDCISHFTWTYEDSAVECDHREWTGVIGINALLDNCGSASEDVEDVDGSEISRMRVEFEMSSVRNVEIYMAGQSTPHYITTTRTTLMPMLFDFQLTIVVETKDIGVTALYYPVTEVVATLTGTLSTLTVAQMDEIKAVIAAHYNFPTAAIKFTFSSGSIVVTAQVPSDVTADCPKLAAKFVNFDSSVVCGVSQDIVSIREVTERSVVSVEFDAALIAQATLNVYTDVQFPYELVNPRHMNKTTALTYSQILETGTCVADQACVKNFKWTLRDDKESPVCTFSGSYEVRFDVVCSEKYTSDGFECPLVGNEKITTTVSLESGYHCPVTENAVDIALLATELFSNRVDSDDSETVTDSFLNTQKLKFHADVRADNAGLKDAVFIAISIADVNADPMLELELYNDQEIQADGTLLALEVSDVTGGSTDPKVDSSVLSPSFTLIADATTLGLELQETAVFQVTATIAAVYEAEGVRRRALLQVNYDTSTETSRTVLISAERPVLLLEESAAHSNVPAGLLMALLSVYAALALRV